MSRFVVLEEESGERAELSQPMVMILGFVLSAFEAWIAGDFHTFQRSIQQANLRVGQLTHEGYRQERIGLEPILARAGALVVKPFDPPRAEEVPGGDSRA